MLAAQVVIAAVPTARPGPFAVVRPVLTTPAGGVIAAAGPAAAIAAAPAAGATATAGVTYAMAVAGAGGATAVAMTASATAA